MRHLKKFNQSLTFLLFIFGILQISQSLAAIDGRLKPDDQVLEINGQDVTYGSQEQAAYYIQVNVIKFFQHEIVDFNPDIFTVTWKMVTILIKFILLHFMFRLILLIVAENIDPTLTNNAAHE